MKNLIITLSMLLSAANVAAEVQDSYGYDHFLGDLNQTSPLTDNGRLTVFELAKLINQDAAYEVDIRCSSTNVTAPGFRKTYVGIQKLSEIDLSKASINKEQTLASILILKESNLHQINFGNLLNAKVVNKDKGILSLSQPNSLNNKYGCRHTDDLIITFTRISDDKPDESQLAFRKTSTILEPVKH